MKPLFTLYFLCMFATACESKDLIAHVDAALEDAELGNESMSSSDDQHTLPALPAPSGSSGMGIAQLDD